MTKTSQWSGYLASFFAVAYFVMFTTIRRAQLDGVQPARWWALIIGWCMMLAAFSGVVCLVSAAFSFVRSRQRTAAARKDSHDRTQDA